MIATLDISDHALRYTHHKWCLIPVVGKVPVGSEWQKRATNDQATLARMFAQSPHDGVGLLLGERSGANDFDCDSAEAEETLLKLFDGAIPRTPCWQSKRGKHYLFRDNDKLQFGKVKLVIDGLEIRLGDPVKGAQTVLPPSGGRTWLIDPDDCPLAEIPDFVIERILQRYAEIHQPKRIESQPYSTFGSHRGEDTLDVPRWLNKHNREIIGRSDGSDGVTRWHIRCPREDSHTTPNSWRDCCVTQDATGKLGGSCFHASCGMSNWQALKAEIGPLERSDYHDNPPVMGVDISAFTTAGGEAASVAPETKVATETLPGIVIKSSGTLVSEFKELRPAVISGLLRQGEIMNLIATSKAKKSFLVLYFALSIVMGWKLFDRFWTRKGKVLVIDNELHPETAADRIRTVADAMHIPATEYGEKLFVASLRGQLVDLLKLAVFLLSVQPGEYDLIVLDAFYRFLPPGVDENSNADVTKLYNLVDSILHHLGAAVIIVHHSSKGDQSGKAVTDVGSGAGAMSRAADSHVTLRQHEVDNAAVVAAVTRSWAQPDDFVVTWQYPLWSLDPNLDPKDLKRPQSKHRTTTADDSKVNKGLTKEVRHRLQALEACEFLEDGASESKLAETARMNGKAFKPIIAELFRAGFVTRCQAKAGRTTCPGFRITVAGMDELRQLRQLRQDSDLSDQSDVPPTVALSLESDVSRSRTLPGGSRDYFENGF